jgi:hypothetical protein
MLLIFSKVNRHRFVIIAYLGWINKVLANIFGSSGFEGISKTNGKGRLII